MKNVIRILVFLIVVLSSTSCITMMILSSKNRENNINRTSVSLSGKTLQQINRHGALFVTDLNDVVCIVTDFDDYFDGMRIKGNFRRWGTYEYRSVDRTIHRVPIFIREKDYRKYIVIAEELDANKINSSGNTQEDSHIAI